MKLFILSKNPETYFSSRDMKLFRQKATEVVVLTAGFTKDKEVLLANNKPCLVALDPDYSHWQFGKKEIDLISRLKVVSLQTSSSDWVNQAYLKKKKIRLVYIENVFANAVAEWLVMSSLILLRRVPLMIKSAFQQEDYTQNAFLELEGKTVGILGLGRIGTRTAEKFVGLGAKVIYWSRRTRDKRFSYKDIDEILYQSDVLIIALAKNSQTTKLINNLNYDLLKPTSIVLSAETTFINQMKLQNLLNRNEIYGYAWEREGIDVKFTSYKGNAWITPQYAWFTQEALSRGNDEWKRLILQELG